MSGSVDETKCPRCEYPNAVVYGDTKPMDLSSFECPLCGFVSYTTFKLITFKRLKELREEHEYTGANDLTPEQTAHAKEFDELIGVKPRPDDDVMSFEEMKELWELMKKTGEDMDDLTEHLYEMIGAENGSDVIQDSD